MRPGITRSLRFAGFLRCFFLYNIGGIFATLLTWPAARFHAETLSGMLPTGTSSQPRFDCDDQNRHFSTDHLKNDLGGRSARGGVVTLSAQVFKFVLSTATAIVLARLLMPEDYGLIGMVAIVVGFLGMFQYLGLSTATVKWSQLSHQQVSTLFWVNIGLSATIMLLTMASAPLIAWFFKEPRLVGITCGYSIIILITGLSIQHEALLMRQMRFGVTALIEIAAMASGLGVAIIAAWYGAGYWALVINQLVLALVTVVGAWSACRWRPSLPTRAAGVRSMLSYGGNLTGYNIMTYFARNLDNALIGKFWGAYQLGVYSRAYQILLMPMAQINNPLMAVAVPALSRLIDTPARYRAAYLKLLEKIAMVTMPGVIFMIASSDWLVLFLLGPQWKDTGRIFMLLGVAAILQPSTRSALWLFTTQGRAREMFVWGVMSAVIAVISILAGLPWGATGVAASYAVTDLFISTPLMFWYVGRRGPVRAGDFYRTIAPAFCASICSLATLLICRPLLESLSSLIARLSISFIITIAVSLLVFAALPAGRLAIRSFKEMLTLLWKNERAPVV
jgi:O-antigen/teichoic acid export membrane protein